MQTINLDDTNTELPRHLVDACLSGEETLVMHDRVAVARIVPLVASPTEVRAPRQPGSARGLISMREDFDEPLEEFEGYL